MTGGAEMIHPNTTVRDLAHRMRQDDLDAFPVGENDRLIGMVTAAARRPVNRKADKAG